MNWLHVTVKERNICGSLMWNCLHVTAIDPHISGSFILNWLHVTFIHSFSVLSDDRSKASSIKIPPHSAI